MKKKSRCCILYVTFRRTSLIPACTNGDDEAVRALLASGDYNVDEMASDGETALTCAVSANALNIVDMLLQQGVCSLFMLVLLSG